MNGLSVLSKETKFRYFFILLKENYIFKRHISF